MNKPRKAMTPEQKERLTEAAEKTFQFLAWDLLQGQPDQSMTAEDARSYIADYVEEPDWFDVTYEERQECLALAIPEDVCI